ncbi:recombinase family protein [Paracoccus denitrificans]|uniref:Recombinase n=1 Tax=Paracoccus denitrificans (strain Pd 1222) TaxID=318586 RepID=A1B3H0_PARDP|nr:recombinase family protein [Paracoccus denitrificans]ABL70064.1 Recombinase [Paracoccus denitrificans PD1222]QAR27447.1 recombinase family protein [Paracoccus denitrificans]UPV96470.1 recombinase family protein [Paracoccus denitrificans]WQO34829.1 recombinase family protein [Paracoccus denitrificans]
MRVAIYARYSSDQQRDASIADQFRMCRLRAEKEGWQVVEEYSDHAISGSSMIQRPGLQALIMDSARGRFDMVLAEALDRVSRDQEDIAGIYKRMRYADVKMFTLSEGEISELHVGLKGTMNALFIKDLADKTRRGLRGRVEDGKSGGGNSYGYNVVKKFDASGEPIRGDRMINAVQAAVIRRIFADYDSGLSSRTIAMALNREGVPGPMGREWGPSTIHGNRERGTGILHNELYVGRLVWNRLRYVKDPDTGRRVSRLNPESEWVVQDVPDLRIVDQALWDAVKARQGELAFSTRSRLEGNPLNDRRRPKHLFAGLVKCGCCGGGYSMISKDLLGCSTARNKGTCDNRVNIRRDALEASVLNGLKKHLMEPELFREFCAEFTREVNRLRMERGADLEVARRELDKIGRQISQIIEAITDGMYHPSMKEKMTKLEARKAEATEKLANADEPPPLLHPNMAALYAQRITELSENLQHEDSRAQAAEILRSLVDQVTLLPEEGELAIVLRGDLGAILRFAAGKKDPDFLSEAEALDNLLGQMAVSRKPGRTKAKTSALNATEVSQLSLVAGVGFEPTTFRL